MPTKKKNKKHVVNNTLLNKKKSYYLHIFKAHIIYAKSTEWILSMQLHIFVTALI